MSTWPIGTIGTATKDIESMAGKIKKGAMVQIVGIGERGYDLIAENGFKISETGFDSIAVAE